MSLKQQEYSEKENKGEREEEDILKVLAIQKHIRGLNQIRARTNLTTRFNQLSYICQSQNGYQ